VRGFHLPAQTAAETKDPSKAPLTVRVLRPSLKLQLLKGRATHG
jgi:hypothetical protein